MFVVRRAAVLLLTTVTLTCVASLVSVGLAHAARSQTHVVILIDVSGSMVENFDWPSETSQIYAAKWRLILAKPEYLARIAKGRELVDRPSSATSDLSPEDARTRRRLIEGLEGRRGPNVEREIARILAEDALTDWKVPVKDPQRRALIDEVVGFWEDAPFANARDRIRFDRLRRRLESAVTAVEAAETGRARGDVAKATRLLEAARKEAKARDLEWSRLTAARKTEIARFVAMRDELVADRATDFLDRFVEAISPDSTIEAFTFSTPQETRRPTYRQIDALDFSRVSFTSGDTNLADALREGRERLAQIASKAGNLGRDVLVIWVLTDAMHDLYDSPEDREKRQYQAFARDLLRQRDLVEPVHFPVHQPALVGNTAAERAKNYSGLYSMLVLPPSSLAEREQLLGDYRDLVKRLEAKIGTPPVPLNPDPKKVAEAVTLEITGVTSKPLALRSHQPGEVVIDVVLNNASRDFDFSGIQVTVKARVTDGSNDARMLTEDRRVERLGATQNVPISVRFPISDPVGSLAVEATASASGGIPTISRYNVPWFPNPEMPSPVHVEKSAKEKKFRVTRPIASPPGYVWAVAGAGGLAVVLLLLKRSSAATHPGRRYRPRR